MSDVCVAFRKKLLIYTSKIGIFLRSSALTSNIPEETLTLQTNIK
jgi:hypothetical protein